MKLHFEPDLQYQLDAVEAVCDLFAGQELCRTEFTVVRDPADRQMRMGFAEGDLGIGNRLTLLDDELLKNLDDIQLRNGLAPSDRSPRRFHRGNGNRHRQDLRLPAHDLRAEQALWIHQIRDRRALGGDQGGRVQIAADHRGALQGALCRCALRLFLYDSAKLGQVRNFATSPQIQIMVVTVGAINKKDVNNLYKDSEKTGGEKPIDLIKATRPIVIVDEPQSVDGGLPGPGKTALDAMNPLCTLRYSATHVDKHHMVYRLDAVDAYESGWSSRSRWPRPPSRTRTTSPTCAWYR